ncbi:MAG: glycosyltransferase [Deltaproteobacteria bacterium]|nr:glycosyltransferase [Deltaproteobacteria bacterium]
MNPGGSSATRTKVLFLIPSLVQGGAQRQILELMARLPDRFEPVLTLWRNEVHFRADLPADQPRHVLNTGGMTWRAFGRLVQILREERPEIVHCFLNDANFWGRLAALRAGVPIIVSSVRARMMELRYLPFERLLSERCHLVTCNSVGIRDELVNWARVRPERIRVIHNFVDLEKFRPPSIAERQAARARLGLAEATRVLVMPGRFSFQKHQLGFLLALRRLAKAGRLPADVVVLMPGSHRPTLVNRLIMRIATGPLLRAQVRVPGTETNMRELYWASDLLVLSSLWEGLPNVALEACASGLPAVLSHAANLDEIVLPGETGWEVTTGEHAALADTLAQAFDLPVQTWRQMGAAGRQRMERYFRPERALEETLSAYDSLVAEYLPCAA